MRLISVFTQLSLLLSLAGCSSLSMPSLWSSSVKADPTAEALFEEGNRNFNDKRYVRAIDNYSKIRTDHPFSPLMTQVELKIADSYYRNQQYPEAINAFKEFQSMHPTNEHTAFVTLRLGQAHFDQFSSTDRDQKNTEIAKGYFETVVSKHPKSPEAAEAREKLAKCLEYLAEHEFNVAHFYFQQEKFPAARDRFEEIVRKYKDTPTAVKSLFYLGESYRREKNSLRAALAYEAVIQHYPQSKFAADAKSQLAQVEKEKQDPLALLLMRDRRPSAAPTPEVQPDPSLAKLRDLNLVAKTDVVHENPGDEKGFLRRVADKINPFSSSDNGKREEPKQESAIDLLAKRNAPQKKEESSGMLASLWPFGKKDDKPTQVATEAKPSGFVSQIDESLKQKGIDSGRQQALKPPPADLPKTDDMIAKAPPPTDTTALLSSIDSKLKGSGKDGTELPPAPEAAQAFKDVAATQAVIARQTQSQNSQDVQSSGILSNIDQKLKARGVEPSKFEAAPTPEKAKATTASKPQAKDVELEPKVTLEKGPLFLNPSDVPADKPAAASGSPAKPLSQDSAEETMPSSRVLVKGPAQTQPPSAAAKAAEAKKSSAARDDEPKGALDQIRQDVESVGKALNPFRW
jgi:outer membrane protein assembly factor BamD